MVPLTDENEPIFAVDSKKHIKQWEIDGQIKEFRSNLGVVVNPMDVQQFEDEYNSILDSMFRQFNITRTKRSVLMSNLRC